MNKLMLLLPAVLLGMTGCGSLLSIAPLYSDADVIQEPALAGAWQSGDDEILVVRPSEDKSYRVLYASLKDPAPGMLFDVRLVQIQDLRFLDVVEDSGGWTIPGHTFVKLALAGDTVRLSFLDSNWLKERIAGERPDAAGLKRGDLMILPDNTAALRALVAKYANEPRAFDAEVEFRRLRP